VASGAADVGIIPAFELTRQNLAVVPGVGIASRGAVRSILLISKCPAARIRTLAGDTSSRTSVALARIVLAHKFGTTPRAVPRPPALETMLEGADAALIIGDPALRLDPATLPFHVYDLGQEWTDWTGLPWCLRCDQPPGDGSAGIAAFRESARYGREHLQEIVTPRRAALFHLDLCAVLDPACCVRVGRGRGKGWIVPVRTRSAVK
jgi:predicted solute-binding protein